MEGALLGEGVERRVEWPMRSSAAAGPPVGATSPALRRRTLATDACDLIPPALGFRYRHLSPLFPLPGRAGGAARAERVYSSTRVPAATHRRVWRTIRGYCRLRAGRSIIQILRRARLAVSRGVPRATQVDAHGLVRVDAARPLCPWRGQHRARRMARRSPVRSREKSHGVTPAAMPRTGSRSRYVGAALDPGARAGPGARTSTGTGAVRRARQHKGRLATGARRPQSFERDTGVEPATFSLGS